MDSIMRIHGERVCIPSRRHLLDKRLSAKARGVLSTLLALIDEPVEPGDIYRLFREGKGAIDGALAQLEAVGYIRRRALDGITTYDVYTTPIEEKLRGDNDENIRNHTQGY